MKALKNNPDNDFLLTFSDLSKLLKKKRHFILKSALFCALIALSYGVLKPIEYRVEATFKEKGKSQSGLNQSLSALLLNSESHESDALTMLRSRMLVEKLVKAEGLQAIIAKNEVSIPVPFKRIKDNLLSEYANTKKLNHPLVAMATLPLKIEKVNYTGEVPLELSVEFLSNDDFKIESNGLHITEGKINTPLLTDQFAFTLTKTIPETLKGKCYRLTLQPLSKTAQTIAKKFTVEADRLDNSLLKISYQHTDKYQAASHANALMNLYKEHTQQEHQRICNLQIAYLQEKQIAMGKQLEDLMHAHANRLSSDLSNSGFADYTAAMNFLTSNQRHYQQKLQGVDLEIHGLNQAYSEGRDGYDKFTSMQSPDLVNQLTKDIRQHKHEANSLKLALEKSNINLKKNASENFSKSFLGIDLNTAKELYLAYSKELNALEAQEAQFNFIISQINLPDFEISSLSGVLTDPISVEMISKASPLILALKDQDNRTNKEQERLHAGLNVHKNFFVTHLNQSNQLIQLRQQLMKEKIEALQDTHLKLINEQITILENQMADYIAQRLKTLKHEKDLYEHNLARLRIEMANLPQKWVAEQTIHQQMEINQNMIEQISKLVESKNLTSNLEKDQSNSVDLPIVPLHPQSPRLFLLTILGSLGGAFISVFWVLTQSISKGITASEENLRLADQHVSGTLTLKNPATKSPTLLLNSDLETLRRIIAFITESEFSIDTFNWQRTVLLLCNKGPQYAELLADIMHKAGLKILIIDLDFTQEDRPHCNGVLQYFKGEITKPEIEHNPQYDIVYSGGISRFANEIFASHKFKEFMHEIKKGYDWVLAYNCTSPLNTEAETLIKQFSKVVISVNEESLQDIREKIMRNTESIPKSFIITK